MSGAGNYCCTDSALPQSAAGAGQVRAAARAWGSGGGGGHGRVGGGYHLGGGGGGGGAGPESIYSYICPSASGLHACNSLVHHREENMGGEGPLLLLSACAWYIELGDLAQPLDAAVSSYTATEDLKAAESAPGWAPRCAARTPSEVSFDPWLVHSACKFRST